VEADDSKHLHPTDPRLSMASEISAPDESPPHSTPVMTVQYFQQNSSTPIQILPSHPIRDAVEVPVLERPTRGVMQGERFPPVQVVSSLPPRGFNIFDEDSLRSPSSTAEVRGAHPAKPESGDLSITSAVEDFSIGSIRSPIEHETVQSVEQNHASESSFTAGTFSDNSSIIPSSSIFASTPSDLPPSLSRGPSPRLPPLPRADPVMLVPQAVRSAGYLPGPTSAEASSHSSHYNVPNPFIFDSRKGPNPLRLPPQSASPFRPSMDLDLAE